MTDRAVLKELGRRGVQYRLNSNMIQKTLAAEAGVSRTTLQRFEQGEPTETQNLVRIFRALGSRGPVGAVSPL